MAARPRRRRRAAPKLRLRRWLRRQDRFTRRLLIAVAALSVLVVALIVPRVDENQRETGVARRSPPREKSAAATPRRASPAARKPAARPQQNARAPRPSTQPLPQPTAPPAARLAARAAADRPTGARAAIVIDDLGQSLAHFEQLADLDIPFSLAVIPGLPASSRTVSEASRRGIELLLHQPMEPREEGGKNPGSGVLLTSMTPENLRAQVRANLDAVPGAVGVNNHMGSRFTEDAAGMGALMAEIKASGLFWLDSRTTAATRGVEIAHAAGVPAIARDIFLDADVHADDIRRQLRGLIRAARTHGTAVAIGHPHPETIAVLRELRGELLASGVTLVPVSALVRGSTGIRPGPALAAAVAGRSGAGEPALAPKPATP